MCGFRWDMLNRVLERSPATFMLASISMHGNDFEFCHSLAWLQNHKIKLHRGCTTLLLHNKFLKLRSWEIKAKGRWLSMQSWLSSWFAPSHYSFSVCLISLGACTVVCLWLCWLMYKMSEHITGYVNYFGSFFCYRLNCYTHSSIITLHIYLSVLLRQLSRRENLQFLWWCQLWFKEKHDIVLSV